MSTAALETLPDTCPAAIAQLIPLEPVGDAGGPHGWRGQVASHVLDAPGQGAAIRGAQSALESTTVVHVFEPVRDQHNEVIDFRLRFSPAGAGACTASFAGIRVVECGPSVAPGEIFFTLKRVLDSGESVRTTTRHLAADNELLFHQTAVKDGDTVVTTTSIVASA